MCAVPYAQRRWRRTCLGVLVVCAMQFLACTAPVVAVRATSAPPPQPIAFPLQVSSNGRYLVDQNNRPVFWSGDAGWSLIAQVSDADADLYLDNRQQKGVTVVVVELIEHKFATHAPRNANGDLPFTGQPFVTPNEAYFAHADYVISSAQRRGMAVLLDPLYLGYGCGDEGWCAEVQAASTADLVAWGQYVGARYAKFDNIVWLLGGDVDPTRFPGVSDKVNAFAGALTQADSRHLITGDHAVR